MLRRLGYGPSLLPKEINLVQFGNDANSLVSFFSQAHSACVPRSMYAWIKSTFPCELRDNKIRLFLLGRGPSCDIHLVTERFNNITSFYHCLFIQIDHATFIVDLNTSNGTMVANKWIDPLKPVLLNMRDHICFGSDGSICTENECYPNPFQYIYFKMRWNATKPKVPFDERLNGFMKRYRDESNHSMISDLECCVCFDMMNDPYIAPCGHSCCRLCFKEWKSSLQRRGYRFVCPLCRNLVDEKTLYPNITLRNIIEQKTKS